MEKQLNTIELEKYIYDEYISKIKKHLRTITISAPTYMVGTASSPEGVYVFSDNKGYHYLFTEKGRIKEEKLTDNLFQIVYWIIDDYVFNISLQYATDNRKSGQDFRRNLFAKELELWDYLDARGFEIKSQEISETLKEHPYNDGVVT